MTDKAINPEDIVIVDSIFGTEFLGISIKNQDDFNNKKQQILSDRVIVEYFKENFPHQYHQAKLQSILDKGVN